MEELFNLGLWTTGWCIGTNGTDTVKLGLHNLLHT